MTDLPKGAFALAAAGLLPFIAGAMVHQGLLSSPLYLLGYPSATALLLAYGKIILSFMGGAIWGFGARAGTLILALSVLPALWAFLVVGESLLLLAFGFAALLALDYHAAARGLAPPWWMRLRIPITSVAVLSLIVGAL